MRLKEPSGSGMFSIGQVVRSRKGKDAGKWYVVVGVEDVDACGRTREKRVFVADGRRFTVEKPKGKNAIHLQQTRWVLDEIAQNILSKHSFDSGRFQALLAGFVEMNSIGESAAVSAKNESGASSRKDEGTACQTKTR